MWRVMLEYLLLLIDLARAALRRRSDLVAENLLLRQQVMVRTRPTRKRPRLAARDKPFWVAVGRLRADWRRPLALVQPASVVRWHGRAWRGVWGGRSRCPLGRPRPSAGVRALIAPMARGKPPWAP